MTIPGLEVWTVGHSTRPLRELIEILRAHAVTRLVDVRTVPRSRRNPQFDRDTLPEELSRAGIGYGHEPALGGLRKPRADSVNTAWRNPGFRGYADHMQTPQFQSGLERLIEAARGQRVAVMCAESVPWRCHRSLIADALTARGIEVRHILGPDRAPLHRVTPFARLAGGEVTYPGLT